ncbi:MAG: metallophosphoesterase family protein [Candidatus Nanohaloarchaea archaeon]|nr:metallophosphoesterase family protein [Candidatus Nanohaloarchaea archaeon]
MNIFTAGDFHGREELKEAVLDEVNGGDYDMFLAIGDYDTPEFYEDMVDRLEVPWLALTGNWDFDFEPPENNEYPYLFNYQKVEYEDGYHFILLGAVYPDDFLEEARAFFDGVPNEKRIVASHYPPHMLCDLADAGNRAGFPEFRELIMREKPALWTCGHIHEAFGKESLMDTVVVNAAAEESGKGWRVELGDDGVEAAAQVELVE